MFSLLLICAFGFVGDGNNNLSFAFENGNGKIKYQDLTPEKERQLKSDFDFRVKSGMADESDWPVTKSHHNSHDSEASCASSSRVYSSRVYSSEGPVRKMAKFRPVRKVLGCFKGKLFGKCR
jgi:hypothetical protein